MLHNDRVRAGSFGGVADTYDAARPGYPPSVITAVLGAAPVRVLDVGCGTGIASRLMAAAGANVLGVEADERMAEVARRRGTRVEVAAFEAWDDSGRRFDRVTSFQAWHWIDPQRGAARAADLLEPGGVLCLVWNASYHPAEVADEFDALYRRLAPALARPPGPPPDPSDLYRPAIDGVRAEPRLGDPVVTTTDWQLSYSTEQFVALQATQSNHITLPDEARADVLAGIARVIESHGGVLTVPMTTVLVSAMRSAS